MRLIRLPAGAIVVATLIMGCGGGQPATPAATAASTGAATATARPATTTATASPSATSAAATATPTGRPATASPAATSTAAAAAAPPAAAAPTSVAVDIASFVFAQPVTVSVGSTVTWTNRDIDAHTATAADGSFSSPALNLGESFKHQFDRAGVFAYICAIHPEMKQTVTVR